LLANDVPAPAVAAELRPENRAARHRQTLGFLWMAAGVIRLMEAGALFFLSRLNFDFLQIPFLHGFGFQGLFFGISILMVISAFAAFITGYGLLERQAWARPVAIVLAILALFKIPLGTALGIFTLWVLIPAQTDGATQRAGQSARV
jgi:hypothetical protein